MIPLPKQVKIFLKSIINYVPYLLPYGVLLVSYVTVTNIMALQLFPEGYANPEFTNTHFDAFLKYLPSSLSLFLGSDWASVMERTAEKYGAGISIFFIVQVSITRFVLDNCLLSYFIFTFSEVYWQFHKQSSDKIVLQFEKSAFQKQQLLTKSIFRGLSEQKANKETDKLKKEKEERQRLMQAVRSGTERPSDGYKFFNSAIKMFMSSPRKTFISPTRIDTRKPSVMIADVSIGKDITNSDSGPAVHLPDNEEINHERMHHARLDDVESGKIIRSSRMAQVQEEFANSPPPKSGSPKHRGFKKPDLLEANSNSSLISRFDRRDSFKKQPANNFLNPRRGNLLSDTISQLKPTEVSSSRLDNMIFSPREPARTIPTEENRLTTFEGSEANPLDRIGRFRQEETALTAEDQNQLRIANHSRTRSRTTLRNKLTQIMPSSFIKMQSQGDIGSERR